jgi:serine/threonine protein kinase
MAVIMFFLRPYQLRVFQVTERRRYERSQDLVLLEQKLRASDAPSAAEGASLRDALATSVRAPARFFSADPAVLPSGPHSLSISTVLRLGQPDSYAVDFFSLELVKKVGAGASADIWHARQVDGRSVAIKSMRRAALAEPGRVAAFLLEATTLLPLRHACVVALLGVVVDAPRIALVLEWCGGGSLRQVLDNVSVELSWAGDLLRMACDLSAGLRFLHELPLPVQYVDLKSSNVLLTSSWGVRLADFGSAVVRCRSSGPRVEAGERQADVGGVLGATVPFAAPEVLRGEASALSADVWSLGCVSEQLLVNCYAAPGCAFD